MNRVQGDRYCRWGAKVARMSSRNTETRHTDPMSILSLVWTRRAELPNRWWQVQSKTASGDQATRGRWRVWGKVSEKTWGSSVTKLTRIFPRRRRYQVQHIWSFHDAIIKIFFEINSYVMSNKFGSIVISYFIEDNRWQNWTLPCTHSTTRVQSRNTLSPKMTDFDIPNLRYSLHMQKWCFVWDPHHQDQSGHFPRVRQKGHGR